MQKTKVPVIVSDIDGVIKYAKHSIPQAIQGFKVVRKTLQEIDSQRFPNDSTKLPFYLLTNRGNITNQTQIDQVNDAFGFNSKETMLEAKDVILNYAGLVQNLKNFQNKLILVVTGQADEQGVRDGSEIIQEAGHQQYITVEEYATIVPNCVQQSKRTKEYIERTTQIVKQRLNLSDEEIGKPLQCHAIFIMANPKQWEEAIQIIIDLLSTEDGKVASQFPEIGSENHIPIYCSYGDLLVRNPYRLPRIICGGFVLALKSIYQAIYKCELEVNMYGKPELHHFEYAQEYGKNYIDENHEISQYYMIGDNPHTDIRGANTIGWCSIMVRTGVFQGNENDPTDPAKYVVDNFTEAIKLIFQLEGINYDWEKME